MNGVKDGELDESITFRVKNPGLDAGNVVVAGVKKVNPLFDKGPTDGGGIGLSPGMPVGDGVVYFIKPYKKGKNQNY